MRDTKKTKIIHNRKKLKKRNFLSFSQNRFLGNKKKFHPLFLSHFRSDRAENFFGETSSDLG